MKGLTVLCFLTQFQWVIQGMKNGRIYLRNKRVEGVNSSVLSHSVPMGDSGGENGRIYLRNKRVEGVNSSVLSHSVPMGDSGDEKWKNLLEEQRG